LLLSEFGRSQYWLQDWIAEDLSQLGPLTLMRQEQTQSDSGNLDLLAASDNTYYLIGMSG
jgi:hypothetical protein